MNAVEIALRAINDAAPLALFGMALYQLYARDGQSGRWLWFVAWLALASNLAASAGALIDIAGDARALLDLSTLRTLVLETGFGHVWLARGVLGFVLVAATWRTARWSGLVAVLAATQLLLMACAGHAAARAGALGIATLTLHLLAVGAWFGGLLLLWRASYDPVILQRFSCLGYAAATLAPLAGLSALFLISGSPAPHLATTYGRLAALKLVLFVILLSLAAFNRLFAVPRQNWTALRRGIAAELGLMGALMLTAATLSASSPDP